MDAILKQKFIERIVELEALLEAAEKRVHDRDMQIVGLNHMLLVEREATRCDTSENFSVISGGLSS